MATWDIIAVTCRTELKQKAFQWELDRLKKQGTIPSTSEVMCISDPEPNVGGGGAVINAILYIVEHLSARKGCTVLDTDVLKNKRIVIMLEGRYSMFDPLGKTFLTLPPRPNKKTGIESSTSNFESLFTKVSNQIALHAPPGVWIVSTDMIISEIKDPLPDWSSLLTANVVAFSFPVSLEYARKIGVYDVSADGHVSSVLFQETEDKLNKLKEKIGSLYSMCGLFYLSVPVAEKLMSLHVVSPIDGCTILGIDSGAKPYEIHLVFHLLAAMCSNWSKKSSREGYIKQMDVDHGSPESSGFGDVKMLDPTESRIKLAEQVLLEHLGQYKVKLVILKGEILYPSLKEGNEYMKFMQEQSEISPSNTPFKNVLLNSVCNEFNPCVRGSVVINSDLSINNRMEIDNCILSNMDPASLGIVANLHQAQSTVLLKDLCAIRIPIIGDKNEYVIVTMGKFDAPFTRLIDFDSTIFGAQLQNYMQDHQITNEDLWQENEVQMNKHSLAMARLFPKITNEMNQHDLMELYSWLQCPEKPQNRTIVDRWRQLERMSINEIYQNIDMLKVFSFQRLLVYAQMEEKICLILRNPNNRRSVLDFFQFTINEGRENDLLNCLHELCLEFATVPSYVAYLVAKTADLLGCMAHQNGGLRSGPAANPKWKEAYALLDDGKIKEGLNTMKDIRLTWMKSPQDLIRCARHYEGASQIFIRHAVFTARAQIDCDILCPEMTPTPIFKVRVECPARIDLSGGWTDTPPICYERGGTVVAMALKIDGKRPISCTVNRIEPCVVKIQEEDQSELTIYSIDDLMDFNKPCSPGALVKSILYLIYIQNTRRDENFQFEEFLRLSFHGGLQIKTHTFLPRGSGLGSSSIMAACVLQAFWTFQGKSPQPKDVIHGVLLVEQLMTTGGGWEDQMAAILPGVKIGRSHSSLPLTVTTETIPLDLLVAEQFNKRILLIYTGLPRLARNLLQGVIRRWYDQGSDILETVDRLQENAVKCAEVIVQGDWNAFGHCLNEYWKQKKTMAEGCEPEFIQKFMECLTPFCSGMVLTGAGGGGFLFAILQDADKRKEALDVIHRENQSGEHKFTVYSAELDLEGMLTSTEEDIGNNV